MIKGHFLYFLKTNNLKHGGIVTIIQHTISMLNVKRAYGNSAKY